MLLDESSSREDSSSPEYLIVTFSEPVHPLIALDSEENEGRIRSCDLLHPLLLSPSESTIGGGRENTML